MWLHYLNLDLSKGRPHRGPCFSLLRYFDKDGGQYDGGA
jgi:hypothetical protein